LIFIVLLVVTALLVIGLSRLWKLPLKFSHLFDAYDKETIALNDQLKTKIKSLKFQLMNSGAKQSQLTKIHDKLRKSNNPNLHIFASDTQKIMDENFDYFIDMNDSDPEGLMHDSLKSTSLSFAFETVNYNTTAVNLDNISIPTIGENSITTVDDT